MRCRYEKRSIALPSQADELITHRLRDALVIVDIRVLDHFVVAAPPTPSASQNVDLSDM